MDLIWDDVWSGLRANLLKQPRCADHPQYPCVRTLVEKSVNDVLAIDRTGIRVRSHRTANEDVIPVASFKAWWNHLEQRGTAALRPGHPNCPRSDRARLVGAIIAHCLPDRVEVEGGQLNLLAPFDVRDHLIPQEVIAGTQVREGACKSVLVNAYERDASARRKCIAVHGTRCCICDFSFGETYGPVAEGFIEVHHLRPLGEVREAHGVDPVEDLRPVCPNCHAVLHRREKAYSIEEVRGFLNLPR